MLGSLSEKIERLQAARGDDDVLRQIEQRIVRTLSEKLEASEAKLGNLDSIDRGMKELLVYLEGIRTASPPLQPEARPAQNIVHDVLRTQESLEAAHGTIGDVVDRLAMIETGMRGATPQPAASQSNAPAAPTISAIMPASQKVVIPADRASVAASAARSIPPAAPRWPRSAPAGTVAAACAKGWRDRECGTKD